MIFGSLIAGGTSMGGGVVAFPVFTKVLHIPAYDAKVFSLAIQSVGMGAASLIIYLNKIPVEWRIIRWGSLGGLFGVFFGANILAQLFPSAALKMSFSLMLSGFAITLFIINRNERNPHLSMPCWGNTERIIIFIAGLLGGIMTGLVGTGIDIFVFIFMVLLFHLCEKVATPTSVILMAFNAMWGFFLQIWWFNDFSYTVQNYWLAAVPVVVIGAPLGAVLCSYLNRLTIVYVLINLIIIELVSSLLLIPLNTTIIIYSSSFFTAFLFLNYWLLRVQRYHPLTYSP